MSVKIRQLQAFDAAARLGSFVDAAGAMHVTPAALSLSIRELEAAVGFRVLERTTRRLRLTQAGQGYLAHAQRVLAELAAADRFARNVVAGHSQVRIATTQTIIATLLMPVLGELHQRFPRLRLQPLDIAASAISDALPKGVTDTAIGVGLPSDEQFEVRPLLVSRWFAYLRPDHPLARRRRLAWSDLGPYHLYMTHSANYLKLRAALGKGIEFADVQDSTTATAGMAMASVGTGIAVFPGYVQSLAQVLRVKGVPIETPSVPHELQIGVRRQPESYAPLHELRDAIVDAVARHCAHLT